jgi:acyl-CoA thioesterase I
VLQARVTELGLPWQVINAGVGGDTTSGGLRRVDALLTGEVGVLVVALGANDGLRGVAVSVVEANLSTIIERAQERNIRVLLCGMETPPLHGLRYSLAFHQLFPRVAVKYDVPLVPFLLSGVVLDPDLNGNDGIHPNAAGARQIAETVWPYLEPLVRPDSMRLVS